MNGYVGQNFPTEDEELPTTSYANIARMNAEGSAPQGGDVESIAVPAGVRTKNNQSGIMSKDEADQYLTAHRAKTGQGQPDIMSKDDADAYLAAHRAQQSKSASQTPTVPSEAPQQQPEQEQYPLGVGLSTLFHDLPEPLQNVIRNHPYLSGAVAAGAIPLAIGALPEEALGAGALWAGRNIVGPLAKWGLGYAGLDWLTGGNLTPKIMDLLTRGLDQPGGGGTP